MNLADALKALSLGHLAEQAVAGEGTGVMPVASYPRMINRLNTGLLALYSRFPLHTRVVTIATVDGRRTYPLQAKYAQTSASAEPDKFIQDSVADPFTGDLALVVGVQDEDHCDLPLNDRSHPLSWHLPLADTLVMDYPRTGDSYFVEYRARHPELPVDAEESELATIQILLPPQLHEALQLHVAASVYGSMSMDGALLKSQKLMAMYEAECARHELIGTFAESVALSHTKLEQRGFA